MKRFNKHWFEPSGNREFSQIESVDSDDFLMDIKHMLSKIERAGMQRAIVVDLTAEEVGVPVVRVIVPGLEISGVDPDRVGMRCKRARDEARRIPRSKPSG
jgi:ribosomal protein S12 methylthiotransferase accessory factor